MQLKQNFGRRVKYGEEIPKFIININCDSKTESGSDGDETEQYGWL